MILAEEVGKAVCAMAEDKAPGPNGFSPLFFQRYWSIVREEVIVVVQLFFTTGMMPEVWRRTFIVMIPKR